MKHEIDKYDVIVVGGGHAGIEAASASARIGARTLLLTMDLQAIGRLSCNPAIGGMGKGQLVSEIDALGGLMGRLADGAGIQFKMLGRSKGPAMWSPRAQMDKDVYPRIARELLERQGSITLMEGIVDSVIVERGSVSGVVVNGRPLGARAVVLCAGTFLCGKLFTGEERERGGRMGEPSAERLSGTLADVGFATGRMKTGTPPRIHRESIDYTVLASNQGDDSPIPFSWSTTSVTNTILCHVARTGPAVHETIRNSLARSPLFSGAIAGTGPRYCPSIEDKIHRFADKDSHMLFLEPEGLSTDSVYVNGFSTSIPREAQVAALRGVPGLERAEFLRHGYAVEYDYFPPHQLERTMASRLVPGLFFAGQVNGTSGYEEAAAQGLLAGSNAALHVAGRSPLEIGRDAAYIGVLVDDLVTLSTDEPYRMFTSRAEYRLLLRRDNADLRLSELGYRVGLVSRAQFTAATQKRHRVARAMELLRAEVVIPPSGGGGSISAWDFLRRPDSTIDMALPLMPSDSGLHPLLADPAVREQIDITARYEGYIARQEKEIAAQRTHEDLAIPAELDYSRIKSISAEGREKLAKFRPKTLGQARRISGVSQSDLAVLRIYMR